jgi:hypothetical protein
MPTHLIIISDMEFDEYSIHGNDINSLAMVKQKYEDAGYEMPTVVFWNVRGRLNNVPAQTNDRGVLLVSGASQNVINFVLKKEYDNLMSLVEEVVNDKRYQHIV